MIRVLVKVPSGSLSENMEVVAKQSDENSPLVIPITVDLHRNCFRRFYVSVQDSDRWGLKFGFENTEPPSDITDFVVTSSKKWYIGIKGYSFHVWGQHDAPLEPFKAVLTVAPHVENLPVTLVPTLETE